MGSILPIHNLSWFGYVKSNDLGSLGFSVEEDICGGEIGAELQFHLHIYFPPRQLLRAIALCGKNFEEVSIIPTGFEAFGLNAYLGGFFIAQQVERDVADDRHVFRAVVFV